MDQSRLGVIIDGGGCYHVTIPLVPMTGFKWLLLDHGAQGRETKVLLDVWGADNV